MPRRGLPPLVALLLVVALAIAGCGGGNGGSKKSSSPLPPPVKVATTGTIAAFGSGVPGSPDAIQELKDAKYVGFTHLVNYSSMNAKSPEGEQSYFRTAQQMQIGIIYSLADAFDDDEISSNTAQSLKDPAVTGVLISDERPGSPADQGDDLLKLKRRYDQVKAIVPDKLIIAVLYWNPDSLSFYKAVKSSKVDALGIDYYPFPRNKKYGLESAIPIIGRTLKSAAGSNGWFVLQAFGWDPKAHPEGKKLGYTSRHPAPDADQMVGMAQSAVQGGASNLMFFSLDDPHRSSLEDMRAAVQKIRAASWWTNN